MNYGGFALVRYARVTAVDMSVGQGGERLLVPSCGPFHELSLHGVVHLGRAARVAASPSMEPARHETFTHDSSVVAAAVMAGG